MQGFALLATLALLVPAPLPVSAQGGTTTERPAPRTATPRIRKTTEEPFRLGAPAAPAPRADLAPMPDRRIEAPRERVARANDPVLEPMLLPPDRRQGATFGREHLRETGPDRPFDLLVPGARLRIPIE